jgi:hypothetical protein
MTRKKKPRAKRERILRAAPTAFWLSQGGAVVPVQIHAEALMWMPDLFGLAKGPYGRDEVNDAMGTVIEAGWVRGRMLERSIASFQAWRPDGDTIAAIRDFLVDHSAGIESVWIETIEPRGYWQFTLGEFLGQSYPSGWGLGDPEAQS